MISNQASRKAAGAITLLWVSSLAAGASAFVAQVLLSRYLGPTVYGRLAAALATVSLFFPIAGFGVSQYWLRIFGLEGQSGNRWLRPSMQVAGISSAAALCALVVWSYFSGQDPQTRTLVVWLAPLVVSQAAIDLVSGRFQLEERYQMLALWQSALPASRLIVVIAGIAVGAGIGAIVAGIVGAALVLTAAGAFQLFQMVRGNYRLAGHTEREIQAPLHVTSPRQLDVLSGAWPFALSGVFYLAYFQSAVILLEWISVPSVAAVYNVALLVLGTIYLLPMVIYQKYLMPKLQRWAEHDQESFLAVYRLGNGAMLMLGVGAMLTLLPLAPVVVKTVFGKNYAEAGTLLMILSGCVPLRFLSISVGSALLTENHVRYKVKCMAVAAIVNVALTLGLLPTLGVYAAVVSMIVTEGTLLGLYSHGARKYVLPRDFRNAPVLGFGGLKRALSGLRETEPLD